MMIYLPEYKKTLHLRWSPFINFQENTYTEYVLTACDHMVTPIIQMQNKKQFLSHNQIPMLTI